jgi:multidrug efflux system outer membrane protein
MNPMMAERIAEMRRRVLSIIGLMLLLSGCALTPDYERPELELPEEWSRGTDDGASIANLSWWEIYDDAALSSLIEAALEQNQDLAVAMARMQESDYLVTFTRAEQFPFLDIFGGAGRGRQNKEFNPSATTENNFSFGASLSFEIDLWRKYARGTEASRADLLSTEAAYRNVTISLIADVASGYLLLLDQDTELAISRRTAAGRSDRLKIVGARFEKGTVPELDVNQAQVQLAIAEAAVAQFQRQVAQTEHALRVLLGYFPGPIPRGEPIGVGDWPVEVPAGLPSELLERRPDIVEAEQQLVAETARVGVAQALRFPAISLTAEVSAIAEGLTDLNSTDAGEWNILAGIFQPLFNSGQLKAQMRAQRARAEQAQHAYIGVLQNAFREVEDALVGIEYLRVEREARGRQVVAASNAARLSRARYDGGVVDYLEVLDSERSQFEAELAESAIRRDALTAYVTLYKALGGGWTPDPDEEDQVDEEEDADESKPGDETEVETVEDDEGTTIQQSASRSTTGN